MLFRSASVDESVGRLLTYLDEHHLTDNTIIVYILSLVMALLVMLAVVFGMERLLGKSPWMVLLIIVAAGIVYFAVLLLLHNEIVEKLVKKIKSRGKHL